MTVFIILQYNNYSDTEVCLNSVLKYARGSAVVAVDNNSTNGAYEQLVLNYKDNKDVHILQTGENLGFSGGNNAGCRFALERFKNIGFLCVFNNDTYIDGYDFTEKINAAYQRQRFDILGPMIWQPQKKYNQNPFRAPKNLSEVKRSLRQFKTGDFFNALHLNLGKFYYKYLRRKETGIIMHGAAIIFSKDYFSRYAQIFPEYTFMYCEEALIYYRLQKDNLSLAFDYSIKVYHTGGGSTDKQAGIRERRKKTDALIKGGYDKLKELHSKNLRI